MSKEEKRELLGKLYLYLSENSYLKTPNPLDDFRASKVIQ
jgi:arginine decarboxylase